jgi:uncharacterized protein (DUF4415 family)
MPKRHATGKSKIVRVRADMATARPRNTARHTIPSEAEIERRSADDPENPPLTAAQLASMQLLRDAPPKVLLSLRIDAHVLAAYRRSGKGWQTRMNEVLSAAVTLTEPSTSTVVAEIEAAARRTLALAQRLRQRDADD